MAEELKYRQLQIDRTRADSKQRTVEASLSSETPYEREFGFEVLSHAPGAIDFSRAANGLPLFLNHDPNQIIGKAENIRVENRRLKARLRFAETDKALETWKLIQDGFLSGVSIGYMVESMERTGEHEGIPKFTVNRWMVYEATTTPLPADTKVGIGRSTLTLRGTKKMEQNKAIETETIQAGAIETERERVKCINTTAEHFPALSDMARRAIADGTDLETFNTTSLAALAARAESNAHSYGGLQPGDFGGPPPMTDQPRKPMARTSRRALKYFGNTQQEQESNAYACGQWARAVLFGNSDAKRWLGDYRRAMAENINSKGGATVPIEMSDAIIDLREEYGVARQELRILGMGSDHMVVPRRTGGVSAYWIGENTQITESEMSWDDVNLVARKLACLVRVSSELAEDSIIDLGVWLADEMAYSFAEMEDDCLFNGDGTSTYGGIQGATDKLAGLAGAVDAASGHDTFAEITIDDLTTLASALPRYAHRNAKWYCSQTGYQTVFQALAQAAGGKTMLETGSVRIESYSGYPIVISEKMPVSTGTLDGEIMLLFGDLSKAGTLGDRRMVTVKVDESRYLDFDQSAVQATERFDIVVHDVGDDTTAGPVVGLVGNA